jgi:hypothetical protein
MRRMEIRCGSGVTEAKLFQSGEQQLAVAPSAWMIPVCSFADCLRREAGWSSQSTHCKHALLQEDTSSPQCQHLRIYSKVNEHTAVAHYCGCQQADNSLW